MNIQPVPPYGTRIDSFTGADQERQLEGGFSFGLGGRDAVRAWHDQVFGDA